MDGLVGLSFVVTLENHDFVILRANSLLTCYLQDERDQLVGVLDQVGGHLVPDDTTASVNLPHCRGVDRTSKDNGLWSLTR